MIPLLALRLWDKFSAWIVGIGAALAALAAALLWSRHKGVEVGRDKGYAEVAKEREAAQKASGDAYGDATEAVQDVKDKAAKQPPPDVQKRDDFDNTGFPE